MSPRAKAKAIPYIPRRAALNWIDFLVIAATVLTFAAVFAASKPHAQTQSDDAVITSAQLPAQTSAHDIQSSLVKARIGLALAGR